MTFWRTASGAASNFPFHQNNGAAERAHEPARTTRGRLAGAQVLVVEDEFIIALEIQSILEEAGATVIGPAYTVAAALELATHGKISAAILDLRLGRDTAAAVASALAARHTPFVFYSGQPASDPIRRAWPDSPILSKPAHPQEIVAALADIIRTTH